MKKLLIFVLIFCSTVTFAQADGWKLKSTTVYGNGGYWENNQKTRIDCSYKKGVFQYERKVTQGKNMDVFSAKAVFAEPSKNYAPGDDINVRVEFSEKGTRAGYSPYARVTVMSQHPRWTKGNGASRKIPASGKVDGQAVDASGRNVVMPPETVTLMAQAPSGGSQMAIVYSCNGMDVVYCYDWDGAYVAPTTNEPLVSEQNEPATQETESLEKQAVAETTQVVENENLAEPEDVVEENKGPEPEKEIIQEKTEEETDEEDDERSFPILKYVIVIGVAIVLIVLILILFRKKGDKTSDKVEPQEKVRPAEQPATPKKQSVCPNCGAPVVEGNRFCWNCGKNIN